MRNTTSTLRTKVVSTTCALALVGACVPIAAFASPDGSASATNDAASAPSSTQAGATSVGTYDKANFYVEADDDSAGVGNAEGACAGARGTDADAGDASASSANDASETDDIALLSVNLNATVNPVSLSSELMYFAQFESGNYDQGFSAGDGYHAMGCYQFDNRYTLQDFLIACYNYDPDTYSMLAWLKDPSVDVASAAIYDTEAKALTEIGQRLEDSWHAAYAADPEGFSRLQDGWYYQSYMEPAIEYLNARGLNMDDRRDCVKGLASGVMSLFGSGGWRQFVGGTFNGVTYKGAGLTGDMTDREFVTALCNYIVDHVAEFYPGQPQYHEGWQNRYRSELEVCLSYIGEDVESPDGKPDDAIDPEAPADPVPSDPGSTYPADIDPTAWYVEAYEYVTERGIMNGYGDGSLFGPDDSITRGQVACVLWNMAGSPNKGWSEDFSDVNYNEYYGQAIRWARFAGVINGSATSNTFDPDRPVTRQELACMIANYAKYIDGADTWTNCANLNARPDADEVDTWAYYSVAWAIDAGVISGVSVDGVSYVQPTATATRAQMAAMCMNYLS